MIQSVATAFFPRHTVVGERGNPRKPSTAATRPANRKPRPDRAASPDREDHRVQCNRPVDGTLCQSGHLDAQPDSAATVFSTV